MLIFSAKPMARSFDKQTSWIIVVFLAVSFLWTAGATVRAFLLPKSYVGTARIDLDSAADSTSVHNEIKVILSPPVLTSVIAKLQLKEKWAHRYFNDEPLKLREVFEILVQRVDVSPKRNTSIVTISSYSDNPNEAADIANAIADSYRDFKLEAIKSVPPEKSTRPQLKILDPATVPLRPCKPIILLSIITGFFVSIPVGLVAAGMAALWFVFGKKIYTSPTGKVVRQDSHQPEIRRRY